MSDPAQTILDTLAEIGPARLGAIADHSGCTAQSLKWALRELRAKGKIVSTGATVARVHALPGQKPAEGSAPPQPRKKKQRAAHKAAKKRHPKKRARAAKARSATPPAPSSECIAAVTGTPRRLVVIGAGAAPHVYTREQTLAIADTVLDHFEA